MLPSSLGECGGAEGGGAPLPGGWVWMGGSRRQRRGRMEVGLQILEPSQALGQAPLVSGGPDVPVWNDLIFQGCPSGDRAGPAGFGRRWEITVL